MTMVSIILLAMMAAFLGLRLYSVLGKRTGHEQEPVMPRRDERAPALSQPDAAQSGVVAAAAAPVMVYEPEAEAGMKELLAADRSFDAARFLEGARGAYRMILEAFWSGDRAQLAELCDRDSTAAFVEAIAAREARGEVLDNRLVAISDARITGVRVGMGVARVTVAFDADIAAITRNADGQVIAGSMTDAMQTKDRWTFVRDLSSRDPNWKLDETEAD